MKRLSIFIYIIFLFIVDQGIKLIIRNYFFTSEFSIINPILAFKPAVNEHYSWINSIFNLNMGFAFHVIIVSLLLIMSFLIYGFIQMKKADFLIVKIAFVFLYSGLICALIDIIFWGGSLDYIWLKAYFTFDLKDCYINTFEILMAIAIIKYHRIILGFKSKEFFKYCSVKFKSFSFLLSK